jgi:hypothetical protein
VSFSYTGDIKKGIILAVLWALLPACGGAELEGELQPLGGVTLTMRVDDRPIAVGAFYSGIVIVKSGDHYGWLTDGYDFGDITVHETELQVSGRADKETSVIAINPAGSRDFVWNLTYGATPALAFSG